MRDLLGLGRSTKTETLEAGEYRSLRLFTVYPPFSKREATLTRLWRIAIRCLGGNVPARRNEPTPAVPGRTERAAQVSGNRREISQLFEVIVERMGYPNGAVPKRELILRHGMVFPAFLLDFRGLTLSPHLVVAEGIERQGAGMRSPAPRRGGGPGGRH